MIRTSRLLVALIVLMLVSEWLSPAEARMNFGTYTGNDTDPRVITLGAPAITIGVLWVFAVTDMGNTPQAWWACGTSFSATWQGASASALPCAGCALRDVAGSTFTVQRTAGGGTGANAAGVVYQWVAFETVNPAVACGSYAGDGTNPRTITVGSGWQPDFYLLIGNNGGRLKVRLMDSGGLFREYSPPNNGTFFVSANCAGAVLSILVATGFQVCGAVPNMNQVGQTYWWHAFKENQAHGIYRQGYNGTGVDNTVISATSASPQVATCFADDWDGATVIQHQWRSAAMAANTSKDFAHNTSPPTQSRTDGLKAYTSSNFTLGASVTRCNRTGGGHEAFLLGIPAGWERLLSTRRNRLVQP